MLIIQFPESRVSYSLFNVYNFYAPETFQVLICGSGAKIIYEKMQSYTQKHSPRENVHKTISTMLSIFLKLNNQFCGNMSQNFLQHNCAYMQL